MPPPPLAHRNLESAPSSSRERKSEAAAASHRHSLPLRPGGLRRFRSRDDLAISWECLTFHRKCARGEREGLGGAGVFKTRPCGILLAVTLDVPQFIAGRRLGRFLRPFLKLLAVLLIWINCLPSTANRCLLDLRMTRLADMIAVATALSSGGFNFERSPQVVSAYRAGCGYRLQSFRGPCLTAYKVCHKIMRLSMTPSTCS